MAVLFGALPAAIGLQHALCFQRVACLARQPRRLNHLALLENRGHVPKRRTLLFRPVGRLLRRGGGDQATPAPPRRRHKISALAAAAAGTFSILMHSPGALSSDDTLPPLSSGMERVNSIGLPGALSIAFSSQRPLAYVYARDGKEGGGVVTFNIDNPIKPVQLGRVDVPSLAYLEDINLGEREGLAFVLVRHSNLEEETLAVVEVTDPANPIIRGNVKLSSHTYTCVGGECLYAYMTTVSGSFHIIDLTDIQNPKILPRTVPSRVGTIIHDWHYDGAGVMWALGSDGIAAYDVADPTNPVLLNISNPKGLKSPDNEYNDRLWFHGALRPNAKHFEPGRVGSPSVKRGDVLLVSEEGDDVDCTDSFQTWAVPALDKTVGSDPPLGTGTIAPISYWRLIDAPQGTWSPTSQLCSVHWFDFHQDGFVAMATYGNGTRVLDVRDATKIKQIAYHFDADDAAVQSYWVPERRSNGKMTGKATNIVYTADAGNSANAFTPRVVAGGGIDIFRATLPVP